MSSGRGNPFWPACLVTIVAWVTGIDFWWPIAAYFTDWKPGPLDALHGIGTTITAVTSATFAAPVCGALCAGGGGMHRARMGWSFVAGLLLCGLARATFLPDLGWLSLLDFAVYCGILAASGAGLWCGIENRRREADSAVRRN